MPQIIIPGLSALFTYYFDSITRCEEILKWKCGIRVSIDVRKEKIGGYQVEYIVSHHLFSILIADLL